MGQSSFEQLTIVPIATYRQGGMVMCENPNQTLTTVPTPKPVLHHVWLALGDGLGQLREWVALLLASPHGDCGLWLV